MVRRFSVAVCSLLLFVLHAAPAVGQGGVTSTISGIVTDNTGAVIPGANVVALHKARGVSQEAITNSDGTFAFPSMQPGTYAVTVTLTGFRTVVIDDVVLTTGSPANLRATLEIGTLSEQVTVTSSSEIVQTISSTVSSTITTNQITKLPLTSRSAMDFVTFLPGVSTPAGNRDATINGLPRGMINITLDGVNVQDNTLRTDRRVLRDRQPASRRGGGGDRHYRHPGRR